MRVEWLPEELVGSWTLMEDWRLIGNKAGATRLGFAALLKFFELEAAFPAVAADPARRVRHSCLGRYSIRRAAGRPPATHEREGVRRDGERESISSS